MPKQFVLVLSAGVAKKPSKLRLIQEKAITKTLRFIKNSKKFVIFLNLENLKYK